MTRSTGPDLATRQLVIDRLNHACLRCGQPGQVIHHRRPRKRGGTRRPKINLPENLVWICHWCHSWIESHRAESYVLGWLVKEGIDGPAEVPLRNTAGRELWLTEDGGVIYTQDAVAVVYDLGFLSLPQDLQDALLADAAEQQKAKLTNQKGDNE